MAAFDRYTALLEQLYLARSEASLTTQQEYEFACDLEALWNDLDDVDREKVEALTEDYKRAIDAPEDLGIDLKVNLHERTLPRKPAAEATV
jgi:hypothetical protein